uniref:methionine ABC transporter substrate-binding lipoprotein MetQ n=1 Tax=Thaumasiovibrio occultus TaxID=1891184 RepID=UPI000B354123|nr:methionine ABC transporter substrate-binding lipoprotein MetQ [Thaumasiovibrio occultus]
MTFNLKSLLAAAGVASTLVLAGCGEKPAETTQPAPEPAAPEVVEPLKIKVGVMAGAEQQVAEIAVQVAKEQHNLEVELVTFTDYVTPNAALADGSIDANAFQHKPYLDKQIADRGYELEIVGNTFVYPIAGYSQKIETLEDLVEGAQVAVPNDPTNLGRSLLLLQQQGLLTLKDDVGLLGTVLDITENPKNLEIVELEGAQLPRSLPDVDLAIINNTFASNIDLTPEKDGLFVEDKESPYVNIIVARKDNAQDEAVQLFVKSYQTDAVHEKALEQFKGGVVKGW